MFDEKSEIENGHIYSFHTSKIENLEQFENLLFELGGMAAGRLMRRGSQPLPPTGVSDHFYPTAYPHA